MTGHSCIWKGPCTCCRQCSHYKFVKQRWNRHRDEASLSNLFDMLASAHASCFNLAFTFLTEFYIQLVLRLLHKCEQGLASADTIQVHKRWRGVTPTLFLIYSRHHFYQKTYQSSVHTLILDQKGLLFHALVDKHPLLRPSYSSWQQSNHAVAVDIEGYLLTQLFVLKLNYNIQGRPPSRFPSPGWHCSLLKMLSLGILWSLRCVDTRI